MRFISIAVLISFALTALPAAPVLASVADHAVQSASLWQQIGDLFRPAKTQSNVEQLSSPSEPVVIEQPVLSIGDYFASRWDNVKESVSNVFNSIPLPHFTNPLSNFTFPKIGNNTPPAPAVLPVPEKKVEASVTAQNPQPDIQAQQSPASPPQSSLGSVLKTELISGAIGAAAGFGLSLSTKTFLSYSADYLAPVITEYASILTYSEYVTLAGTGFGAIGGGLVMYAWGGENANPPAFLRDTARQFRKTVDDAYVGTINLFTLKNSQYNPEKPNQPTLGDILTGHGDLQSNSPNSGSSPISPVQSAAGTVPAGVNSGTPAPAVSGDQPDTIIGGNLNWAGSFTVTYFGCGDANQQFGPYTADWTSHLAQLPNTPDLVYGGPITVVDGSFGGNFRISFDEAAAKWKALITTADFTVTNSSYAVARDSTKSFIKGSLVLLPGGSQHAIGMNCQSGSGNFSGKAGQ